MISRNIKISADLTYNDWGCRVLIYGYNGYAKMKGVEFVNCGQWNGTEAGIKIDNANRLSTEIEKSVFHHCFGICAFLK